MGFFRFIRNGPRHYGSHVWKLREIRRKAWILALGRKKEPNEWDYICNQHFLSGENRLQA